MIKIMNSSHIEQMKELMIYAWPNMKTVWDKEENHIAFENSICFGEFDKDNQLTSQVLNIPFDLIIGRASMKTGGICAVVSTPEVRGNHGVHRLFEQVFNWYKENDIVLSVLSPFSYKFYRQFGYEHVYNQLRLNWASNSFPAGKKNDCQIKRVDFKKAKPIMKELYHQDVHMKRFGMKRQDWWWDFNENRPFNHNDIQRSYALCYDEQNECSGYLVYAFIENQFYIDEIITKNLSALQALTHFIHTHKMSVDSFTYCSPIADPSEIWLLSMMEEQFDQVKMTIEAQMMLRIVNVQKFLSLYPYRCVTDDLSFEVMDRNIEENNGIFAADGTRLEKGNQNTIKLAVEEMVQLFSGFKTVDDLLFTEKITCMNGQTLDKLKTVLVDKKPVLADDF